MNPHPCTNKYKSNLLWQESPGRLASEGRKFPRNLPPHKKSINATSYQKAPCFSATFKIIHPPPA